MLTIDGQTMSLEDLFRAASGERVVVSESARHRMAASRAVIERIVKEGRSVYGVNTGFGKLSDVPVPPEDLCRLQLNLVRSHACGVGRPLSEAETRAMAVLRLNCLATGLSGARPEIGEALAAMLNAGIVPIVPEWGSVGASGDLAPLAHLALALIGEGEVLFGGRRTSAGQALGEAGLQPLALEAKEGLSLLNGTQAMAAVGGLALLGAEELLDCADIAAAMSLEALLGTPVAFDARIHSARGRLGQIRCAARIADLLSGSEIRESHRVDDPRVQDAYSLRCVPQVHGAVADALAYARGVVEGETAAATDNPLVFAETGEVISGGNFHGAPLAHAFDFARIVLVDLLAICERRIDRIVNPDSNEGLPPFLSREPGVSSGFMISHVASVALLAEARALAHPASIDNLPTSGGKEDHVSMGMTSALLLRRTVELGRLIVATELLVAAEGIEHRRPLRSAPRLEAAHSAIRTVARPLLEDRPLGGDVEALAGALHSIRAAVWPEKVGFADIAGSNGR